MRDRGCASYNHVDLPSDKLSGAGLGLGRIGLSEMDVKPDIPPLDVA
jgi:hypothetical protein